MRSNDADTRSEWRRCGEKEGRPTGKKTQVPKTEDELAADKAAAEAAGQDPEAVEDFNVEVTETEYELNRGKSWIGWISRNNGGKVDIKGGSSES